MEPDLLLFAGCAVVAWMAGIEMGAQMADLTPPLNELAIQLALLHNHCQEAKAKMQAANEAKAVVEKQLAAHIKRLQEEFSL